MRKDSGVFKFVRVMGLNAVKSISLSCSLARLIYAVSHNFWAQQIRLAFVGWTTGQAQQ